MTASSPAERTRLAARRPPGREGRFGRQPAYWALRERDISQGELATFLSRPTSYVSGFLNGFWAPGPSLIRRVGEFLGAAPEALFTAEVLEASKPAGQDGPADTAAGRGRVGRHGRQPAYWLLRNKGISQTKLVAATGRPHSYVSQILNGWGVPDPSFVRKTAEFLDAAADDLFTSELLEAASRPRPPRRGGAPPSRRVGSHGRQPAYWVLREEGVRQGDMAARLGRSTGFVSAVLNGFSVPDRSFVEVVAKVLKRSERELFSAGLLQAVGERSRDGQLS